jgi:hypothetical protein
VEGLQRDIRCGGLDEAPGFGVEEEFHCRSRERRVSNQRRSEWLMERVGRGVRLIACLQK